MAKTKKKLKTLIKTLLEEREILQKSYYQAHSLVWNISKELMECRREIREKDAVIERQKMEIASLNLTANNLITKTLYAKD